MNITRTLVLLLTLVCWKALLPEEAAGSAPRPNLLWITSEDNGPHLGCYGDDFAETPHLDRLAARGLVYLNCWSNAPVCAPARTAIISGLYPPSTGAQHMRSMTRLPDGMEMFPQLLWAAGYYCTNNSKEDYNLEKTGQVWHESSRRAHWKNRGEGQPFFAVFNHTISHESQIRRRPHTPVHDAAKVRIPAYHPDTPEVRRDWAQYYDKLTEMDALVGQNLQELEEAGLADDTIVVYFGDHGSGMPRSKRWPYNSGLHVPLIVHIPEKFKHLRPKKQAADVYTPGGKSHRLVSFVDLAPTMLSLIGVAPPAWMQGRAFLGELEADPRDYVFGFRGRMDERYDMVRSVRDQRYVYIRHYMPHKIYGQYIAYMFQTPTTRVWKQLYDADKLQPPQTHFWERKPPEELYDLQKDPEETLNLADSPQHQKTLARLRGAQQEWSRRIRDLGFLPEGEIHRRAAGDAPYTMAREKEKYPLDKIMAASETATMVKTNGNDNDKETLAKLKNRLRDNDSAVRYWSAMGMLMRGKTAVAASQEELRKSLTDSSPFVRVTAAEALAQYGDPVDLEAALPVLLKHAAIDSQGVYVAMTSLAALDALDNKAARAAEAIAALPTSAAGVPRRMRSYVPNLIKKTLTDLKK